MNIKTITISCILTLAVIPGFCQSFRGIIRDEVTNVPLPYANIGIRKKNMGGTTDQQGRFQVDLTLAADTDTLIISYIGYASRKLPIATVDLKKEHTIMLKPMARTLQEVVVTSKQEVIILGNKSKTGRHSGWGDFSSSRGRAIGLLMSEYEVPIKVNKLFFHLDACEFDSARVRINFFKIEAGQLLPLESQKQNIFLTIRQRKGWVEVPLGEDIFIRKEQIVVAIEWVDAWAKPRTMEEGGSYVFTLSLAKTPGKYYVRQVPEESIQLKAAEFTPSIYLECFPIRE